MSAEVTDFLQSLMMALTLVVSPVGTTCRADGLVEGVFAPSAPCRRRSSRRSSWRTGCPSWPWHVQRLLEFATVGRRAGIRLAVRGADWPPLVSEPDCHRGAGRLVARRSVTDTFSTSRPRRNHHRTTPSKASSNESANPTYHRTRLSASL